MSEIKLKNCPFCGGEAYFSTNDADDADDGIKFRVMCHECGITTKLYDSAKCAIRVWNKRTGE